MQKTYSQRRATSSTSLTNIVILVCGTLCIMTAILSIQYVTERTNRTHSHRKLPIAQPYVPSKKCTRSRGSSAQSKAKPCFLENWTSDGIFQPTAFSRETYFDFFRGELQKLEDAGHDMRPVKVSPCRNSRCHHAVQVEWECKSKHGNCTKKNPFRQVWVYDWTNAHDTLTAGTKERKPMHLEIRNDWRDIGKDKKRLKKIQLVNSHYQKKNSFAVFHEQIFRKGEQFTLAPCCTKSDIEKNCMMFADNVCRILGGKGFASKCENVCCWLFCTC